MSPATPAPASKEILRPWQRRVVGLLLGGFVLLAATGLFLLGGGSGGSSAPAAWALLAHLAAGVLLVPLLLAFVLPHAVVHLRRRPVIGLTGAVVLIVALGVALTGGLYLLLRASLRPSWTWAVHVYGGFGLVLLYAVHRRFGTNPAPWPRLVGASAAVLLLAAGLHLWQRGEPGPTTVLEGTAAAGLASRSEYLPSMAQTGAGGHLPDSSAIDDRANCATCHARIVDDWSRSAHRHASMTNPFYKGTIQKMRERYPLTDTKWCASCHDPALLFTGKMDAEDLDFDGHDARVGLSCMSCHAVEPQSTLGNGDYRVRSRKVYAWERSGDPKVVAAHDVLLKLKPEDHVESLRPENIREATFCSLCHKAEVPPELNRWKWNRAQDEYDFWHDSGVSMQNARSFYHPPDGKAKRCQDCHMPPVLDADDPAADAEGYVRSHMFTAANTALPYLRGDQAMIDRQRLFLQTALQVDLTGIVLPAEREGEAQRLFAPAYRILPAVRPGEVVEAHVVVRNKGVGHRFPGGTIDSNEAWLEFRAAVGDEDPFYVSGAIDPKTLRVDPEAEFYRAYWMDRHGKRVDNRIGPDMYSLVYVNVIGPGTAKVVRYRFRVPEGAQGPLRLSARVRYRKFMGEYVDLLFPDRKIPHTLEDGRKIELDLSQVKTEQYPGGPLEVWGLPVVDLAKGELVLPVTAEGTTGAPPPPSERVKPEGKERAFDRERLNDLAIAYLIQEDPRGAASLFEEVTRVDPAYADGWVNVGRALFDSADFDGALRSLRAARGIKPGFPKAHFFEGEIHRKRTDFARAEAEYRRVIGPFPQDRLSLKRLAEVIYEQGRHEESLEFAKRMLAIDPEDRDAWYWALQCYKDLGRDAEAAEAEAAFDRFRPDDQMEPRAARFRLADPHLQRMEQPIHVHFQPGMSESAP